MQKHTEPMTDMYALEYYKGLGLPIPAHVTKTTLVKVPFSAAMQARKGIRTVSQAQAAITRATEVKL